MTTPAAARLYEAQHLAQWEGRKVAVHNPQDKPLTDLPVIYAFNNGGSPGWMHGCLLSQDGQWLGWHVCSSEAYMLHDLGVLEGSRPDRHETFREVYPDGYRMEFIREEDVLTHKELTEAYRLSQERAKDAEKGKS